jgi:hypothetical protein
MLASVLYHERLFAVEFTILQLLTIVLASVFGGVSGYLASRVGFVSLLLIFCCFRVTPIQGCMNAPSVAESFSDKKYWIVPEDFEFLGSGAKSQNEDKVSGV